MKLSKLMLTACVAAFALAACQKENVPEAPKGLKSVEISLENLIYTKGAAGEKLNAGDPVCVNDIQIFLVKSDGTFFTEAKQQNGSTPAVYKYDGLTTEEADWTSGEYVFHYVDTDVNKVVVVANMGADYAPANYNELKETKLAINTTEQQDATKLALYGEGDLVKKNTNHTDDKDGNGNTQENQVYTSTVNLTPRVARLEVDGFRVTYKNDNAETTDVVEGAIYDEIKFTQLALVNYMPESLLWDGTEQGTLVNPLASYYNATTVLNETDIYAWLDSKPEGTPAWTYDICDLTCTPTDPAEDFTTPRAYHIFAGNVVPTFFIRLEADGVPAFLYTKNIKDAKGTPITNFQEGVIYRMSADTESAATNDGSIEIPEDVIDPMDRCLEITVNVINWQVVLVTPGF